MRFSFLVLFAAAAAHAGDDPAEATPASPTNNTPKNANDDASLLAALLRLEAALGEPDASKRNVAGGDALRALGAIHDARAVPVLLRASHSKDVSLRLNAIAALGEYIEDEAVRARLSETLLPDAPLEDAAIALPALLAASKRFPGEMRAPCPDGRACVDDGVLLDALLGYATAESPADAITKVGDLKDPRALPFLWRLSASAEEQTRTASIKGLAAQPGEALAKKRLMEVMSAGAVADKLLAIRGLAPVVTPDVTDALLAARAAETDLTVKQELESTLRTRDAQRLEAVLAEERRRLAELANQPSAFDANVRAGLTTVAGVGAATGAAAASSLVADEISPGSGSCYGLWGACAGGASAAAISWFALGDHKLDTAQISLAASASVWGAWAGLLIPPTIGPPATDDVRHMVYSAAAGQLAGLTLGTVGALLSKPTTVDVVEMNAVVLAANALTAGVILSLPPSPDARPLWGSLIGATVLGAGGAAFASQLALDENDMLHAGVLSGIGLLTAGSIGLALNPADDHPTRALGFALAGAGLGVGLGMTLGHYDLTPTQDGMVYETWAALSGGVAGVGGAMFIDALRGPADSTTETLAWGGAAVGLGVGAASVAFFPDGVPQDSGDLLLQPLFVAFGLYHGALLSATAELDPRFTIAAATLTPALVSGGLVYAAPHIRASNGDVLMVASMMGIGAYFSSLGLISTEAHGGALPPWAWVLTTSLAMDAGIAAGVGLSLTNIEHIGWRTTYVCAVAAGTTLVLSLPGSLLANGTKGQVVVSDVLLASSAVGAVIGLATMPLIDFRIAPDWGLGKRPDDPSSTPVVDVKPSVVAFIPHKDGAVPMGLGVAGRF